MVSDAAAVIGGGCGGDATCQTANGHSSQEGEIQTRYSAAELQADEVELLLTLESLTSSAT